jgi:hypothetical protein
MPSRPANAAVSGASRLLETSPEARTPRAGEGEISHMASPNEIPGEIRDYLGRIIDEDLDKNRII